MTTRNNWKLLMQQATEEWRLAIVGTRTSARSTVQRLRRVYGQTHEFLAPDTTSVVYRRRPIDPA